LQRQKKKANKSQQVFSTLVTLAARLSFFSLSTSLGIPMLLNLAEFGPNYSISFPPNKKRFAKALAKCRRVHGRCKAHRQVAWGPRGSSRKRPPPPTREANFIVMIAEAGRAAVAVGGTSALAHTQVSPAHSPLNLCSRPLTLPRPPRRIAHLPKRNWVYSQPHLALASWLLK
jgi:hypothetical protein